MTTIRNILIVRLSSIGDIILTTPFLRSVRNRFPNARVFFLVKKEFEELLSSSPYIDELITFDKHKGLKELIRIKQYLKTRHIDIYFDIHKNWRSLYLRSGIKAGVTGTYPKQIINRSLLIWLRINLYRRIKPVYLRYFEAGKKYGLQYDRKGTEVFIPDKAKELTKELLNRYGYVFKQPLVIICPGAAHLNKQWLPERFAETADILIKEKNAFVIIHGGEKDKQVCDKIAGLSNNKILNLSGTLDLTGSAALLHFATLVIANDSGLLHLAQSQHVPVVGIYGPTTKHLGYFPITGKSTVIEANVSCRPCTHNGLEYCPKKHFRCMKNIDTKFVTEASLKYLE